MKAAIITFHAPLNYGAFLQAYALQEYLEKEQNIDVSILNYQTKKQRELSDVFLPISSPASIAKNALSLVHLKGLNARKQAFIASKKKLMHLTEEIDSFDAFKAKYEGFDLFISGSDQIWNTALNGFKDGGIEPYFLCGCNKRKIAYSTSLGPFSNGKLPAGFESFSESIKEYDAIAMRENESAEAIAEITGKSVSTVLDPVFLLSAADYRHIANSSCTPKEKYILLYSVNYNPVTIEAAKVLHRKTGLNVIVPYGGRKIYACKGSDFKWLFAVGPDSFLDLIDKAEYVVTDSFHGTAFSVIFGKKFICSDSSRNNPDSRLTTLLESFDLSGRIIYDAATVCIPDNIPMHSIDCMTQKTAASKEWLQLHVI